MLILSITIYIYKSWSRIKFAFVYRGLNCKSLQIHGAKMCFFPFPAFYVLLNLIVIILFNYVMQKSRLSFFSSCLLPTCIAWNFSSHAKSEKPLMIVHKAETEDITQMMMRRTILSHLFKNERFNYILYNPILLFLFRHCFRIWVIVKVRFVFIVWKAVKTTKAKWKRRE